MILGSATVLRRGGPHRVHPGSRFALARLAGALLLAALIGPTASAEASALCARGPLADSLAAAAAALADRAQIGALAISLAHGDTLLACGEDRRLIPGSNTKIFSTSAFLRRYGPDARFETRIEARGKVEGKGDAIRLSGDLTLRPAGIPDIVPILAPGSRGLLDSLAFVLRASGLERFEGTLWVDGTLFADDPYGPGVAIDDVAASYGALAAPVFANGNAATVIATAGDKRVSLALDPPETPLVLVSRVRLGRAGDAGGLDVERTLGSHQLRVTGTVPRGGVVKRQVAVPDPDSTAGLWLLGSMRRAGIRVKARVRVVPHDGAGEAGVGGGGGGGGGARGKEAPPPRATAADSGWSVVRKDRAAAVAILTSPPAAAMVGVVNALSLNPEAEGLLRLLDPAPREKGRSAGLAEARRMAAEAGVDTLDLSLVDGSGLSPQNLATARALVAWLSAHARDSVLAAPFREGLAEPGATGTLKRRFAGLDPRAELRAKTGTLTNVSSLSGYLLDAAGERIAFAVITNGNRGSAALAKQMEERIVGFLSRYDRTKAPHAVPPLRIPR